MCAHSPGTDPPSCSHHQPSVKPPAVSRLRSAAPGCGWGRAVAGDEPLLPGVHWGQRTARGGGLQQPPAPQAGLSPRHPESASGPRVPAGTL